MHSEMPLLLVIDHSDPFVAAGLRVTLAQIPDFATRLTVDPWDVNRAAVVVGGDIGVLAIADYDSGMRILSSPATAQWHVIILTHLNSEFQVGRAFENGARGYLLMDCSVQRLFQCVITVERGGIDYDSRVIRRMSEGIRHVSLTSRESQILGSLARGRSNKEVAIELRVAPNTVKSHIKNLFRKLGARNRTEAVAMSQRLGIVPEPCHRAEVAAVGMQPSRIAARSRTPVYRLEASSVSMGPTIAREGRRV